LIWKEVELDNVWVDSKFLVPDMQDVWKKASKIFHERCSMCHALPKSTTFTANQWPATLKVMTRRAALDKNQTDIVSKFLQYHARDTINLKEE
jgi:trimethylamine-N-oxide reductase cytochrome c-type subunit TorC